MFRVYDYTDASRLFGKAFLAKARSVTEPEPIDVRETTTKTRPGPVQGDGVTVRIVGAGRYVLIRMAASNGRSDRGLSGAHRRTPRRRGADAEDFRDRWVNPEARRELLATLPEGQTGAIKAPPRAAHGRLRSLRRARRRGLRPRSQEPPCACGSVRLQGAELA